MKVECHLESTPHIILQKLNEKLQKRDNPLTFDIDKKILKVKSLK